MLRAVAAVVLGYVVVIILTVAGVAVAWAVFGAGGAFAENSTVASTPWAVTNCLLGFAAAMAAGATAAVVGKHPTQLPVKIFAGLMLVLGLGIAAMTMGSDPPPVPEGTVMAELSFLEAGALATQPNWYNWVIPVIGAIGVMVGGSVVRRPN